MFALQKHTVKVSNFNPRAEKNGDANVLAGDIKFEACCGRNVLDDFDASLRAMLFRVPAQGETLVTFNDGDGATGLRMPKLKPLVWDEEFTGYTLTVHSGLGLIEPLVIEGVDLSNFTFEALEGGSVKAGFRASCHPDQEQSGALCELIQEKVEISLDPPANDARQADLVPDAVEA